MAQKTHSDFIDIRGLIKTYVSKWYLFVISIICCLAAGFLFTRIHKEKYGVRANVLIQQEDQSPLSAMGELGALLGTSGNVDDEIFVISSHSLYRDVVRDLGINKSHYVRKGFLKSELEYPDFPVDVTPAPGTIDTLRTAISFKVKVGKDGLADIKIKAKKETLEKVEDVKLPYTADLPYGKFTIERMPSFPNGENLSTTIFVTGYHAAAEALAKDISSEIATKRSNVIELGINTTNAEMGEMILNDLIAKYNNRGIMEKNLQGQKTAEFIEDRLAKIGASLSDDEIKMQEFKENKGLVNLQQEITYQTGKRGELERKLISAETQLEIMQMTKDFISNPANKFELIPMSVDNESLNGAINGYNAVIIRRNDMLRTVSENNSAVVSLSNQATAMMKTITGSLNRAYDNLKVTVKDLREQIGSASSRLGNVPQQEREVINMTRESTIKAQLYMYLLRRQEENSMMLANATPKGIVVDEAYTLVEPLGMSKKVILAVFFLLGLCLPPLYLYILKLMRNRVETREEIERRTSAPILGEMCVDNSGRSLVVTPTDTSSATELFRLMRANLLFIFNDPKDKVVLLTSSKSGEGKTFISINLAATLALLNKKVLLIGMDIRAPKIASYLNVTARSGLTNYLSSASVSLDDIIARKPFADIPTLDVIVAGPIPPNPAELLTSEKVDNMFAELRKTYDYIVVDSAPVGMVSDTFALDRIADATVYVTRVNYTSNSDIDEIEEIYEDNRLKKLSLVINGVKGKKTYGYRNAQGQKNY